MLLLLLAAASCGELVNAEDGAFAFIVDVVFVALAQTAATAVAVGANVVAVLAGAPTTRAP